MKKLFLILSLALLLGCSNSPKEKELTIESSNEELVELFNWAKGKALSFVQTDKFGPIDVSERQEVGDSAQYIPSYWAGYPLRTAFYSRDFCHQITGAHLIGLNKENIGMLKAFAASANKERKWYPLWAINFDGSPYKLDYRNDNDFVREVPATFELVEKAFHLYQWTDNKELITDNTLWNYYTKAVTEFIKLHDTIIPNGIAEGSGTGSIFKGSATFNEQRDHPFAEAGDGIATQYKAFIAYSKLCRAKGDEIKAVEFQKKAEDLKHFFNTDWGIKNTTTYNRGYTVDGQSYDGWGKENSWFIPMKGLLDTKSTRTKEYLNFIDERLESKDDIPNNIEAISYIPEVFFLHHRNEIAWKWMKHIISKIDQTHAQSKLTGNNGNYPEVSYVLISNIVENLMGIIPNAPENKITTLSHLPNEITSLKVNNIPFGENFVSLEHEGLNSTTLTNHRNTTLTWEARFYGTHDSFIVNNEKQSCKQDEDNGKVYSYINVQLKAGDQLTIKIE